MICLGLFLIPRTRYKIAIPSSIAVISSVVLNVILKNIFTRERPDILRMVQESSYSFPSGHAMINCTLYTMLMLLVRKYVKNRRIKIIIYCILTAFIVLIGVSRIYLGVHYAGDIIAGWILGFWVAAICYLMYFKSKKTNY